MIDITTVPFAMGIWVACSPRKFEKMVPASPPPPCVPLAHYTEFHKPLHACMAPAGIFKGGRVNFLGGGGGPKNL